MHQIILFVLFSFIGWLYENLFFKKVPYDGISHNLLKPYSIDVKLPLLPLYGVGGLLIIFIDKQNLSILTKIIIASLTINVLECIAGLLSYQFYGFQTWKYESMTMCRGYISLYTGIWWMLLISMYYIVSNKYIKV